jgi:hypothetical protein
MVSSQRSDTEVRNILNRKTVGILGAIVVFAAITASASAQVIDTTGVASVNVQPALSLTLVASPDWGKCVAPAAGTARYTLSYATGAVTLTSGDGYTFNNGHLGEYTVGGAVGAPLAFSVSIGAFSGSGITVVASHINGTSGSGTGTVDNTGHYDLKVGGIVDIASTATVATQTATVTVTIDYQ